jgi:type II secretory pathway predicted ATPase ExeA
MQAHGSSIGSRAFGPHVEPTPIIAYQSHQDALRFLSSALDQPNRIGLVQGPTGAGKSTVVKSFGALLAHESAVALIDGMHLTPRNLLTGILAQFNVPVVSQHDEQLLQSINNFASHETREKQSPVLIIDNADRATPSALRLLNWLAALEVGGQYALRIVLTGKERLPELVLNDSLRNLARRHPATYTLNPLTAYETMIYLRTRLIAAGGEKADKVFPLDVCERLSELARGWPGPLNICALGVMERAAELASAKPVPRLVLTRDGEKLAEYELTERRYVIGRSDLADIVVEDAYVSKLHAMLQIYAHAIVLIDLNSTNGTTVNSRQLPKTVLRNSDIIMLGRHRLKLENAPAISPEVDERIRASDTMTMQTLDDLRLVRARKKIAALKHEEAG